MCYVKVMKNKMLYFAVASTTILSTLVWPVAPAEAVSVAAEYTNNLALDITLNNDVLVNMVNNGGDAFVANDALTAFAATHLSIDDVGNDANDGNVTGGATPELIIRGSQDNVTLVAGQSVTYQVTADTTDAATFNLTTVGVNPAANGLVLFDSQNNAIADVVPGVVALNSISGNPMTTVQSIVTVAASPTAQNVVGGGWVNALPYSVPTTTAEIQANLNVLFENLAALQAYQKALSTPAAAKFDFNLVPGAQGNAVQALQEFLKSQGSDIYPEGLVTSYYGNLTKAAVGRFQMKHGIVTNSSDPGYGLFDPKTRTKINSL